MQNGEYQGLADTGEFLRDERVRPVRTGERQEWDRLMREHHYLGFRSLAGESLRYVAVHGDRWLALLGWAAAALTCTVRDQWIGWTHTLKLRRLGLVANNCRFLILPDVLVPNLASRILALNLKRLPHDWQAAYGHPIWLAETFVDPQRYRGTCYRAAGWLLLGYTRGFARHHKKYTRHGCIKSVFVRPLRPDVAEKLADRSIDLNPDRSVKRMKLSYHDADLLHKALLTIPDSRMRRGIRHRKPAILSIAVCAIVCGATTFDGIAQCGKLCSQSMLSRLGCRRNPKTGRYEPPRESAIRRFLQSLDPQAVDAAITGWVESILGPGAALSIDGKTLRGARTPTGHQVQLLSAVLHHEAAVVAQEEVPSTTNEITVVKSLLQPVALEGTVVTADALHTQREKARYLVEEKQAHYLFTV